MAKKNEALTTGTKPKIKKVGKYEIYLVDNRGRKKKRICGAQKKNQAKGFVCTNPAGQNTSHPGYAQCSFHDRHLTNPNNTSVWKALNVQAGFPSNLMELIDHGQQIEETALVNVDDDIRLLYSLQSYVFTRRKVLDDNGDPTEEGYLTQDDVELIMKITDKILKAKDLRAKLNKELQLDTATVKAFINQIFKIINEISAKGVADRIMRQILEEVIVPFKSKGRLTGADLIYDPETGEVITSSLSEAEIED